LSDDQKATKVEELLYEVKIRDVMKKDVVTVTPETLMSELREIFRSHRISGTPVVDGDDLVGIISIEDFIKWLADEKKDFYVHERMSRDIKTVFADEPLVLMISKFEKSGFGRFPVIERNTNKMVGVITKGDIIEGLLNRLDREHRKRELFTYTRSNIVEDIVADGALLTYQSLLIGKNFKRAGEAASGLKKTLKWLNIHPEVVRRIAIASYEAEMNVVVFAEIGKIIAHLTPNHIRIEVKDIGPGIQDIEKALEPGYSTAPEWVKEMGFGAGMGLNNIKKCADKMNISSEEGKGTNLEIIVNI
jgi:CBS domain-containing protein/anti-sigma regulatory factor (Ser/Thr protein kinase)